MDLQKFLAIYKKEWKTFFSLPIAYAILVVFMVLSGYFFTSIANYYSMVSMRSMNQYYRSMMDLNIIDGIFRPYFHNMVVILLLVIPLITMRVFAEEKKDGTAELLFTYPVKDTTVVLAKYSAVMTIFGLMLTGTLCSMIILRIITAYDILPALAGILGLLLITSAFAMLGIFVSTLTESQIVAAVISFGILLLFFVISWASQSVGPFFGKILKELSIIEHFDSFSKGLIDTSDIIFYINFTILFFFLTLRILESKQWRG